MTWEQYHAVTVHMNNNLTSALGCSIDWALTGHI
jgi:hypothetical protein